MSLRKGIAMGSWALGRSDRAGWLQCCRQWARLPLALAVFCCVSTLALAQGVRIQKIVMEGDPVSGWPVGSGLTFDLLDKCPAISDYGVGFVGSPTTTSNDGLWVYHNGQINLRWAEGITPIAGTYTANSLDAIILNNAGQVASRPFISSAGYSVVVSNPNGSLSVPLKSDDCTPGSTTQTFHIAGRPDLSNAGLVTANSSFTNPYGRGVFTTDNTGVLRTIAVEGANAPGTTAQFSSISYDPFVGGGETVFRATLTGSNPSSLWKYSEAAGLRPLAIEGNPAPGGRTWTSFDEPRINEKGHVAFLTGWEGIAKETGSGIQVVAWRGGIAPGTTSPFFIINKPVFNDNDQVAFRAFASGATGVTGVWSEGYTGALHAAAITGQPASGTDAAFTDFDNVAIGKGGALAFIGDITGGREGIWAEFAPGDVRLIALEGQQFQVAPGDFRTISQVYFAATYGDIVDAHAHEQAFDDHGNMVFTLDFTDGTTGIFTAQVPEPSGACLLTLAALCLLWWHQRRRKR